MLPKSTGVIYERVAQQLREQVLNGVYGPGDRVPSVRRLSEHFEVSIATVVEAYRRLEAQGVLEARPQSGYYVRARQWQAPVQPSISQPPCTPTTVSVSALAMRLLKTTRDPQVLQLAVAAPHPDLLPAKSLNRILARLARNDDGSGCGYDFPPGSPALRGQIARRALEAFVDTGHEDQRARQPEVGDHFGDLLRLGRVDRDLVQDHQFVFLELQRQGRAKRRLSRTPRQTIGIVSRLRPKDRGTTNPQR